jgi:hypothetical protein
VFCWYHGGMATLPLYAVTVTSSEFADPEDAQGAPASGDSAPYATTAILAAGTAALSGAFAATPIPGTITAIEAVITARSLVGTGNTEVTYSSPVATFSATDPLASGFAVISDTGSFVAATLKAAIVAGTFTLDMLFTASLADTVDAKGMGIVVTYTPFDDPVSGDSSDADDALILTGEKPC